MPNVREYAAKLGMSLIEVLLPNASPQEIERGFAELAEHHADAMLLSPAGALTEHARQEYRLPAMYHLPLHATLGGLMTYTYDPDEMGRQLADDVHRILQGAKPADIPIYQPTRFKLTINLNAAKAIGLMAARPRRRGHRLAANRAAARHDLAVARSHP